MVKPQGREAEDASGKFRDWVSVVTWNSTAERKRGDLWVLLSSGHVASELWT
jgi:hypothetical protein